MKARRRIRLTAADQPALSRGGVGQRGGIGKGGARRGKRGDEGYAVLGWSFERVAATSPTQLSLDWAAIWASRLRADVSRQTAVESVDAKRNKTPGSGRLWRVLAGSGVGCWCWAVVKTRDWLINANADAMRDPMLRRPIGQSRRCSERQKRSGERRDPFWAAVEPSHCRAVEWMCLKRIPRGRSPVSHRWMMGVGRGSARNGPVGQSRPAASQ